MKSFLKEPLLHFVLIGALVFAGHAWLSGQSAKADRTIVITKAEMERLAALYTSEAGTLPGEADVQAILASYVRDQALAREAIRLGLNEEDTIITRRLSQKMEFMVSDLASVPAASEADLRAHYEANQGRFKTAGALSFRHIFLGEDIELEEIVQVRLGAGDDWRKLGKPFMLQREYGAAPPREVARIFGRDFALTLNEVKPMNEWVGPVQSALGYHLIYLSQNDRPSVPPFEQVRARVAADWLEQTRREANAEEIAKIIGKYDVVIEGVE